MCPGHSDWADWEELPAAAVCLFCEKQAEAVETLHAHMEVRCSRGASRSVLTGKAGDDCSPIRQRPWVVGHHPVPEGALSQTGDGPRPSGEPELGATQGWRLAPGELCLWPFMEPWCPPASETLQGHCRLGRGICSHRERCPARGGSCVSLQGSQH